jgi:hypothetical protein
VNYAAMPEVEAIETKIGDDSLTLYVKVA